MCKTLIVLLGPTAVGKTELSLQLAEHYGAEILSADSRQIYRDLPICTAAATAEQRARVPHHFVGTHGLEERYSAAQFETDVLQYMAETQHPVTILTGGSMMYIDAVVEGIDDMPEADPAIREQLKQLLAEEGLQPLLSQLQTLDPEYFAKVDRQNPLRVLHGLEMCLTTGQPFSSFHTGRKKERPFWIVQIGLRRDREELYARIDKRVAMMVEEGLEAETKRVYDQYHEVIVQQFAQVVRNPGPTQAQPIPNLTPVALNTVGLKEMLLYHEGIYSFPKALERICHNSYVYSKKQMTWFQRKKDLFWIDLSAEQHKNEDLLRCATDFLEQNL